MPAGVVLVFWIWTAVSIVILMRRAFRRPKRVRPQQMITNLKADKRDAIDTSAAQIRAEDGAPALEPVPAFASLPAAPPSPTRTGAFAKEPEATAPPVAGRITVATVLRGISLPHGLAPLTTFADASRSLEHRAVFVTTNAPPEVVGRAVADELERIGLAVQSIADDTAVARRGDEAVQVQIFVTGSDKHPRFPTAPPESVVVQFEVVS